MRCGPVPIGCSDRQGIVSSAYNSQKAIMPTRPDSDSLGFVILDVARMLRSAFERRIATAGLGLTPGEARALVRISAMEGSRQHDIAQRMSIEPMTLSTYLDRLQSLGFVERRPDPSDRRAKLIYTTPAADDLLSGIRFEQIELMQHVTGGFCEEELEQMRERMARLRANLVAIEEDHGSLAMVKDGGR